MFSSVQSLSRIRIFATPWLAACQASLSITNSRKLLKLMSIESVMPSNHLILCHSLLLLPSILPSIRVFSNKSALRIRWPKYWSFSFSISPSNEHSGLMSFKMDWLDRLAVQGTLAIGLFSDIIVLLHPYSAQTTTTTPRKNQTDHPRRNSSRVRGSNSQTASFRYPTQQAPLCISPQMYLLPTSTAFPANFFTNSINPCGHPPSINSILKALNWIQCRKYLLIT